ncbi:MAG: MFS transporter, partial [Omnitrophica WOR_2 bacterium]
MPGRPMDSDNIKHYRANFWWNLFDGGFFGMALGFASFMTIIPLFVSNLTSSAVLIGLIPAIHAVGWQFPQLFVARRVSAMRRYKPAVMFFTVHERLPFLGMAFVAWFQPHTGPKVALALTFLMLVWQGVGGGLTAPPWQSLIGKIIPSDRRGTFLGFQSSLMNLFSSFSAVIAGIILDKIGSPLDYTLCFLLACVALVVSYVCVGMTFESASEPLFTGDTHGQFLDNLVKILRRDRNFRWYLVVRILSQLAVMAFAFYTVYAVRHHGMSPLQAGVMTAVLMGGQIIANPLMGWLGDRRSHAVVMEVGAAAAMISALVAWMSP